MKQNKKIFIIAEAGVNHNGSVEKAKKMIDRASYAGADAIKFQSFKAENLVIPALGKARYQAARTPSGESQFEMLKRMELTRGNFRELSAYCKKKKIIFMSSPFDEDEADFLGSLGMKIFKIPSGEITNKPLILHIARKKKDIILSTGMSYLEEIKKALGWINSAWQNLAKSPRLTILHATSNYPAVTGDVNLMSIKTLKSAFGLPAGYSDHTLGIEIALAAAAMGAAVIEKHFTLDRRMKGPDHEASLTAGELGKMIKSIRNIERAMGDGIKRPVRHEKDSRVMFRKSLRAARDIKAGSTIKREDIAIKRPGFGISPEFIDKIVDKKTLSDINKDSLFKKTLLSMKQAS